MNKQDEGYATLGDMTAIFATINDRTDYLEHLANSSAARIMDIESKSDVYVTQPSLYCMRDDLLHQISELRETVNILLDKYNALNPPISFDEMMEGE